MKESHRQQQKRMETDRAPDSSKTPDTTFTDEKLKTISSTFKRRLNRLKDTTTKLFEQQDNDSNLLHDCSL